MLRERLKTSPDDGGVWTAKKVTAVIASGLGLERVAEQRRLKGESVLPLILAGVTFPDGVAATATANQRAA